MRNVYLKPITELDLSSDKLLELLKPLYGLPDSGDYWNRITSGHLLNDLCMPHTTGDMSLFFKITHDSLLGLIKTYVDDSLASRNSEILKLTEKTQDKFESRPSFAGVSIRTATKGIELHQSDYISTIELLPTTWSFELFRSHRMKLA